MAHSFGLMEADMKVNLRTTILKVLETMFGLMVENMKGLGKIIKCMEEVFSLGLMVADMKECMLMIRNKVMEILVGQMGGVIEGNGRMGNKMEKALTKVNKVLKRMEYGSMAKK